MMTPTLKGFEIALNIQAKMLWLRIWGACDPEFEKRLELALRDKILELGAQAQWPIWYVLVDASQAAPPAGETDIAEHVRRPFLTANDLGIKKVAYVSADPPIRWDLPGERDGPHWRAFTRRETALEWLSENTPSIEQSQKGVQV